MYLVTRHLVANHDHKKKTLLKARCKGVQCDTQYAGVFKILTRTTDNSLYWTNIRTTHTRTLFPKTKGRILCENIQLHRATHSLEENIWLPFKANGNLWLCQTWRAVSASALFFHAGQWDALMDSELTAYIHDYVSLPFIQNVLKQRSVFFSHTSPLMKRMTATQYFR